MQAFKLREQHAPDGEQPFTGGSFALADGSTFDIADGLKQRKDGVIVTESQLVATSLVGSGVFEETDVPADAHPKFDPATATNEDLDAILDAKADEVVKAAGASGIAAEVLLAAEQRRDKPRQGVVDGLTGVAAAAQGAIGGDRS